MTQMSYQWFRQHEEIHEYRFIGSQGAHAVVMKLIEAIEQC